MPAGDGTGPDGRGGWCTPLLESGQISQPIGGYGGRGNFGRGRRAPGRGGRGRGYMNMYYATGEPGLARAPVQPSSAPQPKEQKDSEEIDQLKSQVDSLKEQLDKTSKKLEELEKK